MKEVYYKGKSYKYNVWYSKFMKTNMYDLLDDQGNIIDQIPQHELDIKSIVSIILESYYKNTKQLVS